MSKTKITPKLRNDIILLVCILLIAIIGLVVLNATKEPGATVRVLVDGVETERYSINDNLQKEIVTEYGKNILVIKDGKVSISDADCPDLVCAKHREISSGGEIIVCLPHKLVIEITSETEDFDMVV
jgi:hypothetical protein